MTAEHRGAPRLPHPDVTEPGVTEPGLPQPGATRAGPSEPVGIDELLERVRAGYDRVDPSQAAAAAAEGALLVDIRYAALREKDGLIPGALVVERNELEWRLDPRGSHRLPQAVSHDQRVVVICNEGYASSLAVASLRQLGLHRATDLTGGFQAWRAAGLPVTAPGTTTA
ncbi:sulfurtransferase [Streptomyces sp. SID8360]|nr:Rhodanese domain protein [Streptomyces sp. SirexAA-E]MYR66231.1 sulfurtransferase [Streptomyces sp. SID4939]MYS00541.1 sulfurtransferase [Streptomyces sp. SID4940]MYT65637.1 sulfurtransferase [Streptomyces sp. SID8357]MYT84327.1 sulfurtransferase [Streptomyces sp. SID8360]MYW40219.1 sulfurtransferase [Streptomyces sp. SID1]MYX72531.1 sulfurtransferase [Streptomyces sp. SID3915]PZX36604.1 rhodanese-related sulfurtransferase [Streptomyces sp. DvalAA-21]RAJ31573.1 rhodanese-related sulfurtr